MKLRARREAIMINCLGQLSYMAELLLAYAWKIKWQSKAHVLLFSKTRRRQQKTSDPLSLRYSCLTTHYRLNKLKRSISLFVSFIS